MSKERELIKDMKILLECTDMGGLQRNADVLIGRAKELLAQPEQEPVAWIDDGCNGLIKQDTIRGYVMPLYTAPPKREPLSDEEMRAIWKEGIRGEIPFVEIGRAIEKAHGIGGGE